MPWHYTHAVANVLITHNIVRATRRTPGLRQAIRPCRIRRFALPQTPFPILLDLTNEDNNLQQQRDEIRALSLLFDIHDPGDPLERQLGSLIGSGKPS